MSIVFRYSALDTAHRCLYKYKKLYLDGDRIEGLDSIDTTFGTAMHAAVEAALTGGDGLQVFKLFWDAAKAKEYVPARFSWEQLADLGQRFLVRFNRLHAPNFEVKYMEQTIRGNIGAYQLEGTPDFIGMYRGVLSIVDFKTSNREYTKEKIVVNEQMPIYAELARQAYGLNIEQLVYMVFIKSECRIQVIKHPLSPTMLAAKLANVEAMCADLVKRDSFPKNPNSCMMGTFKCAYYSHCHGEE